MSGSTKLPHDRYVAVLRRQRARIEAGLPFEAVDSDAPGDKYTHAAWGLCSEDREAWPDREDHLWPDRFDRGRVAPKYRDKGQRCPMDTRPVDDPNIEIGCFYNCQIFQRRHPTPDRAEAVRLYDEAIEQA